MLHKHESGKERHFGLVKLHDTRPKWKMEMPPKSWGKKKASRVAKGLAGVIIREMCPIEKKGRQGGKHRFDSGRRGDDKQEKGGKKVVFFLSASL